MHRYTMPKLAQMVTNVKQNSLRDALGEVQSVCYDSDNLNVTQDSTFPKSGGQKGLFKSHFKTL